MLTKEGHHYLYSEQGPVEPRDLVCHLLLIDPGTRSRTNALLLIQKEEIEEQKLYETAEIYGVRREVEELITYLETEGKTAVPKTPE